jgi:hypothetical protein
MFISAFNNAGTFPFEMLPPPDANGPAGVRSREEAS